MTDRLPWRVVAITLVVGLTAAIAGSGAAFGAPAPGSTGGGVSTAQVSTKMLDLSLGGGVLNLTVFQDSGLTNVDPASGAPSAKSTLTPLSISSASVPAINALNAALSAVTTPMEAQTPGGSPSVTNQTLNFASPPGGVALPLGLISGTLNAGVLSATLDPATGAAAKLAASLTQLNVVGGLLGANTLGDHHALQAATSTAIGTRTVDLGTITALDLGTLLQSLGLDPTKLPLGLVLGLVDKLGLSIPGLPAGQTSLSGAVNSIVQLLGLGGQAAGAQGSIPVLASVAGAVNSVLGLVGPAALPTGGNSNPVPVSTVLSAVSQLQTLLGGLLKQGLNGVLNTPLIQLDAGHLGVVTKAAPSIADSVAQVTTQLPVLKVAGQVLPGLDLGATIGQVQAVLGQAQSALASLLGALSPKLATLVNLSLLDQSHQIKSEGGYTKALAAVTALTATIDPSKILGGASSLLPVLQGPAVAPSSLGSGNPVLLAGGAIGSLITGLTGVGPSTSNPITTLLGSLNLSAATALLGGPTVLKLGEVTSQAQAAITGPNAASTPPPNQTLPHTGRETTGLAALAAVLVALSLGVRRLTGRTGPDRA